MTHTWTETAADRGLDLTTAVRHDSFYDLDDLAAAAGVVGDTYATGTPTAPREAYAVLDGVLHVAPAIRNATTGGWPNPGDRRRPYTSSLDREGDLAAARAEDARARNNDRLVEEADRLLANRKARP